MNGPAIRAVGDTALLIEFGETIDDATFAQVVALDRALAADPPAGMIEAIPAYAALLVVYDPLVTTPRALEQAVAARMVPDAPAAIEGTEHVVPVRYDGPDLAAVADHAGLGGSDVAAAHAAGDYRVFMYGFAPGYAYLGGVPAALRLPRKAAAVRGHPAGSVMIAGAQCLITTLPMPTGWWVIGHTDLRVLDPAADRPFRFEPGDRVRFVAA